MRPTLSLLFVLLLANGCDKPPAPPPYQPVADVKRLMAQVLEPSADVYWDAVGSIEDSTGTHYTSPRTAEAWDAVRNGALMVTEAGNLLLMPPRARDTGEWTTLTLAMIDAGRKAIDAAEARDTVAVFNAGAVLYDTCTACHAKYAVEQMRPNAK